jgi:hypothetical protein
MTLAKMRLDDNGVPKATGEFEELAGDAVILALGQDVDRSLLDTVPGLEIAGGVVQVDATMMTGCAGVFAGGDAVPSQRSVTVGIGHGKAAARNIDEWLRRVTPAGGQPAPAPVAFDQLKPWYYSDAPHAVRPRLDLCRGHHAARAPDPAPGPANRRPHDAPGSHRRRRGRRRRPGRCCTNSATWRSAMWGSLCCLSR